MRPIHTITRILLCLLISYSATAEGIKFTEGSWEEIISKAQKEQKYIFVDFYADWCGPCIWMSKEVFTTDEAGQFFNDKFINVSIDAEREFQELVEKTYIDAFPTLVIYNAEGIEVTRSVGALGTDDLINFGSSGLNAESIEKAYAANPDDPDILLKYANYLKATDEEQANQLVNDYLKGVSVTDLASINNWSLIAGYHFDHSSDIFQYIWKNKAQFHNSYGEAFESYILGNVLSDMIGSAVGDQDLATLDKSIDLEYEARTAFGQDAHPRDYYKLESYYIYYYNTNAHDQFFETYDQLVRKFLWEDAEELMARSMRLAEAVSELELDSKYYQDVHDWTDQLISLEKQSWRGYLAKAVVHHYAGEAPDARKMGEKALALSDDDNRSDIEDLLASMDEPFGG
ncbi:MAG: thioredoxin family protein [Cytophagales bacterium]|nr:thioredoxin family protein [Cytophagales bacterium]